MSKIIVYVVSIPWDSASVNKTYVFKTEADAKQHCDKWNTEGYPGYSYTGGLMVEKCEVWNS